MRWLFFLLSAVCFAVAFRTYSVGLAALCLLLALLLLVAGVLALASHRIQARARDEVHIASPEELRRLREQAAARAAQPAADAAEGQPPA
jgi:hypothetical protein